MSELKYTEEHEWIRDDGEAGVLTVGVTAYAAEQLGDVVFVDLPAVGQDVTAGEPMGELESTKSVSDLFAPVTGTVESINEDLADAPETVNADPTGAGWLVAIRVTSVPDTLLDEAAYLALTTN